VGVESFYYLFNSIPYLLTLSVMILTCSPHRASLGAPASLGRANHL
jgi:general nucleoside transport system permease protein